MTSDSTQHVSVVYPSDDIRDNLIETEDAERPSLETREWAVYWDSEQRDWYYHDKIRGEQKLQQTRRSMEKLRLKLKRSKELKKYDLDKEKNSNQAWKSLQFGKPCIRCDDLDQATGPASHPAESPPGPGGRGPKSGP